MYRDYASQGCVVLGIGAGQSVSAAASWVSRFGLTFPVLADPSGAIYDLFGDNYVPYNVVIDPSMLLRYTTSGYNESAIRNMITTYIPQVLTVRHTPLEDTEDQVNPIPVTANFISAAAFVANSPSIEWSTSNTGPFQSVPMTLQRSTYVGNIPTQTTATDIYYYLHGENTAGRTISAPYNAPLTLFQFYVGPDVTLPVITHTPILSYAVPLLPLVIEAQVTDNIGVDSVELDYRINGGAVTNVEMVLQVSGKYTVSLSDTMVVGDVLEYRITATDSSQAQNQAFAPSATEYYHVDIIEKFDVYIFDPDPNHSSGPVISTLLQTLEMSYNYGTTFNFNAAGYRSVFVCLGVYSQNYVLTSAQGTTLANFLNGGGRIYMEGGDTWFYDPATAVHSYFHIGSSADGSGDAGTIVGNNGTFTQGMSFSYTGENNYIDRLTAGSGAVIVLKNSSPAYNTGITYTGTNYKTMGSSIEFAGLADGSGINTKLNLLRQILIFFDILAPVPTATPTPGTPTSPTPSLTPTRTPTPSAATITPTPTTTPDLSFTPTPTRTPTPVVTPTNTPSPTTSVPTVTPTPTIPGGIVIYPLLNKTLFYPADPFLFQVRIVNGSAESVTADEFIILEVYGLYYFWPAWTQDYQFEPASIPMMSDETATVLEFTWPTGAGSADDLKFWAALLKPGTIEVYSYNYIEFGFRD